MKKTKIVATIGPASSSKEMLIKIIEEGVNVCRLNFSHGTHEQHLEVINNIREINQEKGWHIAMLADLQGPKLRVGKMPDEGLELITGSTVTFTTNENNQEGKIYITYPEFAKDTKAGEAILLDDGKLTMEVIKTNGKDEVEAKVVFGGRLKSNKGVNLPNTKISLPCLTEKDLKDLEFVLEQDLDWIGLSFVRNARDIIELQHLIANAKKTCRIVAKIEKPEALDDIDAIIKNTDAIMVARGDLGVEIPMQRVPLVQKDLIRKSRAQGKPVIVATQMMESMITDITPTRAEVNDVANAVMDGADAVMLSGETSVGAHPEKVIEAMSKIISTTEEFEGLYNHEASPNNPESDRLISDSICYNACRLSQRTDTTAIVTMTHSGYTAYKLSSQRPKAKIFAFTSNRKMLTTLSLVWGVECIFYDKNVSTDHTIADIKYILQKAGYVQNGDLIVNLASMPITEKGKTNMLKLSRVED